MTHKLACLSFAVFMAGCSFMSKGKDVSTGGGGGEKALAGTMAEAQTFHIGDVLEAPAECHTSGYMRIDAPVGQTFHVEVTVEGGAGTCVDVSYLTKNGGANAPDGHMFGDVCVEQSPKSLEVTGLDGGSFLQVSESGACQGATMKLALVQ
jgi:hypothetical protein